MSDIRSAEGFERIIASFCIGMISGCFALASSFTSGMSLPKFLPNLKHIDYSDCDKVCDITCPQHHQILQDVYPRSDDMSESALTHGLVGGGSAFVFYYFKFNQKLMRYLKIKNEKWPDLAVMLFMGFPAVASFTYRAMVLAYRKMAWESYRRQLRVRIRFVYSRRQSEAVIMKINATLPLWNCLETSVNQDFPPMTSCWFYLEGTRVSEHQLKKQPLQTTLLELAISAHGRILDLSMEDARVYTMMSVSKIPSRDLNKYLLKFLRR